MVISKKSKIGALAVGVPGTIAGIFAVHEKLGSLPIEEIIAPVIALATNGYVLTEKQAKRITYFKESFLKTNNNIRKLITVQNINPNPGVTKSISKLFYN